MSALARMLVLLVRFLSAAFAAVGAPVIAAVYGAIAIGCALLVRYVGEPEPDATPAA